MEVVLKRVTGGHRNEAELQRDLDIFGDAPRYATEEAVAENGPRITDLLQEIDRSHEKLLTVTAASDDNPIVP